jgi:hypothetical protein
MHLNLFQCIQNFNHYTQSRLTPCAGEITWYINMDFEARVKLLIMYFASTWEKWKYNEAMRQLFLEFIKTYASVARETFVQYSHWIWYPNETSKAIKNLFK